MVEVKVPAQLQPGIDPGNAAKFAGGFLSRKNSSLSGYITNTVQLHLSFPG